MIVLSWESGQAFLGVYRPHEHGGRFTWPLRPGEPRPDVKLGELTSLTIRFAERGEEFHVHVTPIDVTDDRITFAFHPDERSREERVRAAAEGEPSSYQRRRHVRVPCSLPVRVEDGRLSYETVATNISDWGLHLELDVELARDSLIFLTIDFPQDRLRLFAQGRVRSVIPAGPQRGISVEFVFDTGRARDAMAEQVQKLLQAG